jgi:hypothetical protein
VGRQTCAPTWGLWSVHPDFPQIVAVKRPTTNMTTEVDDHHFPDAYGIASGHQPITVMLDLMDPVRPGWRLLARRWQAGFDNGRQRHFGTMP